MRSGFISKNATFHNLYLPRFVRGAAEGGGTGAHQAIGIKGVSGMPWLTLSRTNFPLLTRDSSRAALQWNYGPLYNILLSTDTVRVSEAGISWCVTCELHENSFWNSTARRASELVPYVLGHVLGLSQDAAWFEPFSCVPVRDALCVVPGESSMLLFPSSQVRIAADPSQLLLPAPLRDVLASASACGGKNSNRELVFDAAPYEVSLCDLVFNKFRFVLFPEEALVYWQRDDRSVFWTVSVTLLVLFLFTKLCESMSLLIRGKPRAYSRWTSIGMCLALGYSFVNSVHVDFSTEEKLLNVLLQWYTVVYLGAALMQRGPTRGCEHPGCEYAGCEYAGCEYAGCEYAVVSDCAEEEASRHSTEPASSNTMGALIALQLMLTAHLQNSHDTPFLTILVMFFGARSFLKFLNFVLKHCRGPTDSEKLWKFFFLSLDTLTLAGVLELAVRTSARSTIAYSSSAASLLLSGVLAGTFLQIVIENSGPKGKRSI